jgi:soluble lytic murein transglycosylase-like protein
MVPSAVADCDPLPDADLNPLIATAATKEGVKAELIRAVMKQESGFKPCAISAKGAEGLMQLMPATAEEFHIADPFDPEQNVSAGAKLLKQLLTKYAGDLKLALSAYNAGSGRVDETGGVPDIAETQGYVSGIMNNLPDESRDGVEKGHQDPGKEAAPAATKPAGGT